MRVLWLIPHYYSFLIEELHALQPHLSRLVVLSQAPPPPEFEIDTYAIPQDRMSLPRALRRARYISSLVHNQTVSLRKIDRRKMLRIARHNEILQEIIAKEQIDLVHSHFAYPEGTGGWQAIDGQKLIMTLRGVDVLAVPAVGYGFMLDPFYARNLSRALHRADAVTAASRYSLEAVRRICGDHSKMRLLPNGIDLSQYRCDKSTTDAFIEYGLAGRRVIMAAGNLVEVKAFNVLIDAFCSVVVDHDDLALVIIGEGPGRILLEKQIVDAGLGGKVLLPGRVLRERMPGLFQSCCLFVHPSLSEGFGNVVLEAMASSCPVIATSTGAAADLIRDGENGLLVSVGDAGGLAVAINRMLGDDGLRERCGSNAAKVVMNGFSMKDRARRFVELYRECLSAQC